MASSNAILAVWLLLVATATAQDQEDTSEATNAALVMRHLFGEKVRRCGPRLMAVMQEACEFYDEHIATIPFLVAYLRELVEDERIAAGVDVNDIGSASVVERCCKRSCTYSSLLGYCLQEQEQESMRYNE